MPWRHVAAVTAGNALEFYDFLTYAFFATYIAQAFFPAESKLLSLMGAYAGFAVGFVARPIGALILGRMGDRIGRQPAMLLSFSLMGVGIVGLALTPSYAVIGVAAPILVVLFRMLQGFALGGEVGPTTAYLVEAAPIGRRGFYASMQYTSQDFAGLIAGIVGYALAATLPPEALQNWGWRAAMLLGVTIVPFGLALRKGLPETLYEKEEASAADIYSVNGESGLAAYWSLVVLGLMMLTAGTVGAYTISYMTTYAIDTLKMPPTVGFGVLIVSSLVAVIFQPISGLLMDRFGRKPVMIVPAVVMLLSILPCFWLMSTYRNAATLYGAMAWVGTFAGLYSPAVVTTVTESLPKRIRSGGTAIIYAVAISMFGGTTGFVITWLLSETGNPLMPAYYWSGAAIIGLAAMTFVRESSPLHQRMGR